MDTQSQEHLKQAGEIISLRNKWRECWGMEVVIGFSEVAIIFDLGQILYPPWAWPQSSVKRTHPAWYCPPHWVVDDAMDDYIKCVLKKKEVTPGSSEMQMPTEDELVTEMLEPEKGEMEAFLTPGATETQRHQHGGTETAHRHRVFQFSSKKSSRYGF